MMDMCTDCAFWYMDLCSGGESPRDCDSRNEFDDWEAVNDCVMSMRDASSDTQVNS